MSVTPSPLLSSSCPRQSASPASSKPHNGANHEQHPPRLLATRPTRHLQGPRSRLPNCLGTNPPTAGQSPYRGSQGPAHRIHRYLLNTMPVTTIKRCLPDSGRWWYTVEDCNVEAGPEPGTGLTITYYDKQCKQANQLCTMNKEDALLIRDAINQLYPTDNQ